MTDRTAWRTCPLCEAGCGLEITLATQPDGSEKVKRIRGDQQDVFSGGYVCPKGATLRHLHEDPDWLRQPMVRRDGRFVPVSWDEAYSTIADQLLPILEEHGRDAAAIYLGNPNVHNLAPTLYGRALIMALGTRNRFSASTVDQRPKEISSGLMFGSAAIAVPDLDRTDFLLMLGANPHASNGSLCTAPNFPGRLDALQKRGGKLVVVDPRRSETAQRADQHIAIRPGTDAMLLAAMAQVMLSEGRANPGRLSEFSEGLDRLPDLMSPFTPEAVAPVTGISADLIRQLAIDFCESPTAVAYGRIGTTCQQFGTASSWLVDIVNLISGNLDSVGGAMFATGAVGQPSTQGMPGVGRGFRMGRVHSRVSKAPESFGEFPVGILAEEIETPGEGQVRALITVAGNPVSSTPNSDRLDAALQSLDFMVAVDPYINETTRHADVILPPPSALQKSHYDYVLLNLAVRNVANYSPAVLPLADTQLSEAEILLRLAAVVSGHPATTSVADGIDDSIVDVALQTAVKDPHCNISERKIEELKRQLETRPGPERLLDIALRTGPYGDGFGSNPDGLNLQKLEENPHGIDLGALQEKRIPDLLRTPDGKIQVVPEMLLPELERMKQALSNQRNGELLLVGRRHVRSNNSWMHNVSVLTSGRNRCTLQIHPDDAERVGIADGSDALVTSQVGELVVKAECTDVVMPGVVSIPHGFGQNQPGVQLRVATEYDGVNTNILTDENFRDEISGNIALNGVPVTVRPA